MVSIADRIVSTSDKLLYIKFKGNCSHLVIPRLDRSSRGLTAGSITRLDSGLRHNDGRVVTFKERLFVYIFRVENWDRDISGRIALNPTSNISRKITLSPLRMNRLSQPIQGMRIGGGAHINVIFLHDIKHRIKLTHHNTI